MSLVQSRETKSLIDSLGGGLATNTPRSARAARKNHQTASITPAKQRSSDSSLSDLSDTTSTTTTTITLPPSSLPATPVKNTSVTHKNSLRKTIIKRSHSSSYGLLRTHNHNHKSNFSAAINTRRLTDIQKKQIQETKVQLLEDLSKEEELINDNIHPLLNSLSRNLDLAKQIKLNQSRFKFVKASQNLSNSNFERLQRIYQSCNDKKIRIQSDLIDEYQKKINRAPFEFLISNDTTNLQAIFHLTPTPRPTYKISATDQEPTNQEGKPEPNGIHNHNHHHANTPTILPSKPVSLDPVEHQESLELDCIHGLHRRRIKHHAIWELDRSDIDNDLAILTNHNLNSKSKSNSQSNSKSQSNLVPASSVFVDQAHSGLPYPKLHSHSHPLSKPPMNT
ncbi:hypothetical protein PSTG_00287 [Puccinia striiformis f. sp. tritici PST-78]|uniref:Uncharacterized protein n=1 Tax=Puccinia striiformis f. sp. tritici PST-78 TaxID=1165861 RepID=A0A0L0W4H9_9BASI|nr:hypothetical protein PSTG_00287 [Puccinia striiformis f. sp. tritici PST-78]